MLVFILIAQNVVVCRYLFFDKAEMYSIIGISNPKLIKLFLDDIELSTIGLEILRFAESPLKKVIPIPAPTSA
jgi:hypothetical protein